MAICAINTNGEVEIINDLYHNELRLYKNFFQPVMKLVSKERIGSKIHRAYDTPQTPHQRLMASDRIEKKTKEQLQNIYQSFNPAGRTSQKTHPSFGYKLYE